jgi:hypothetical protein
MFILIDNEKRCYAGDAQAIGLTNPYEARLFYDHKEAETELNALPPGIFRIVPGPSVTEIYLKYIDLVRHIAHHMGYYQEVEDAESYLGLIIMTKWDRFDIRVCRRTTWIGREVSGYLLDTRARDSRVWMRRERLARSSGFTQDTRFSDMSDEAQQMVTFIRTDPDECRQRFSRQNRLKKFRSHMAQTNGWSEPIVNRVIDEFEEIFA